MEVVKVEHLHVVESPLTEEKLLLRRLKTAERVRRYRERKKLRENLITSHGVQVQQRSQATGRYRQVRKTWFATTLTANDVSQFHEKFVVKEEEIEDEVNIIESRSKEQDPLELVSVEESVDETSKLSNFEEKVAEVEESVSTLRPALGPNIQGICYCRKKQNGFFPSNNFDCVYSTNNAVEGSETIFRRKCAESSCRGCVLKVISPIERFEISHKNFLQCISSYCTKVAVLDIAAQKGLPEATYNLLSTLMQDDLSITSEQFTRMWRSILLQRVQDVETKTTRARVPNTISLDCAGLLVPAPLSDLLHSIGRFHSTTTGVMHHTISPTKPSTNSENWWTLDDDVLASWIYSMDKLKHKFTMKEMPADIDFDDKPLMMTQIEIMDQYMVQCRAKTTEISITDAYIHMVNDPLYKPYIYAFEDCHLIVSTPINQDYLRREYLNSFIIHKNV